MSALDENRAAAAMTASSAARPSRTRTAALQAFEGALVLLTAADAGLEVDCAEVLGDTDPLELIAALVQTSVLVLQTHPEPYRAELLARWGLALASAEGGAA